MVPSRSRRRRVLLAALAALALALATVTQVAAHAELTSSSPAADATVPGPLAGPIVLTFSEAVEAGSKFELLAADGSTVGTGAVDPVDPTTISWSPPTPLAPGTYQVRWTTIADDGHVERGTFSFTVAEGASPTPSASPSPSASAPGPSASSAPSASAVASAAPSASPTPSDPASTSGGSILLPIAVALAAVAALAVYLVRRRGAAAR